MSGIARGPSFARRGKNQWFFSPVLPYSAYAPYTTIDQQPIDIFTAIALAVRIKTLQFVGSITSSWVGGGDAPDPSSYTLNFDENAKTSLNFLGTGIDDDDPNANEIWLLNGISGGESDILVPNCFSALTQSFNWTSEDETSAAFFDAPLNLGFGALDSTGFGGLLQYTDNKLYLSQPRIQISVGGATAVLFNPYSSGTTASGIDFKICGVPMTLWDADSDWSSTGTVTLDAATANGYWPYNGFYDPTTGART